MTMTEPVEEFQRRNIVRIGKTYYISIPKEWLLKNKILARKIRSLRVIEGTNLTIVNPCNEAGVFMKAQTTDKLVDIESEIPTISSSEQSQRREE